MGQPRKVNNERHKPLGRYTDHKKFDEGCKIAGIKSKTSTQAGRTLVIYNKDGTKTTVVDKGKVLHPAKLRVKRMKMSFYSLLEETGSITRTGSDD